MSESFVFYASFFEAAQCLDEKEQLKLYNAIGEYALKGTFPEVTGAVRAVFCVIKPVIDSNRNHRENGKKGGRPKKTIETKEQTGVSEEKNRGFENRKSNENENENGNVNGNENGNVNETVNVDESGTEKQKKSGMTCKEPKFPPVTYGYEDDGKLHGINENLLNYWRKQFPSLDIEQELRNAESWLDSNRNRRKRNIKSFLTNWMIRSQEKRKTAPPGAYDKFDGNDIEDISDEERKAFDGF